MRSPTHHDQSRISLLQPRQHEHSDGPELNRHDCFPRCLCDGKDNLRGLHCASWRELQVLGTGHITNGTLRLRCRRRRESLWRFDRIASRGGRTCARWHCGSVEKRQFFHLRFAFGGIFARALRSWAFSRSAFASYPLSPWTISQSGSRSRSVAPALQSATFPPVSVNATGRQRSSVSAWILWFARHENGRSPDFSPPFPPAAERWAFTAEESITNCGVGPPDCVSVSNRRTQAPLSAQRTERL